MITQIQPNSLLPLRRDSFKPAHLTTSFKEHLYEFLLSVAENYST